jgi:hypothetical protein
VQVLFKFSPHVKDLHSRTRRASSVSEGMNDDGKMQDETTERNNRPTKRTIP